MRRGLSILLVLLFAAGPLSFVLSASGDASLPACCRRHGAHHCAMDAQVAAGAPGDAILKAPSRCPQFPVRPNANQSRQADVARRPAAPVAVVLEIKTAQRDRTNRTGIHFRTPILRGPPESSLA